MMVAMTPGLPILGLPRWAHLQDAKVCGSWLLNVHSASALLVRIWVEVRDLVAQMKPSPG